MSNGFTWQKAIDRAGETKVRQHLAKLNVATKPSNEGSVDKQYLEKYQGDFNTLKTNKAIITKRIKEEHLKQVQTALSRRVKNV